MQDAVSARLMVLDEEMPELGKEIKRLYEKVLDGRDDRRAKKLKDQIDKQNKRRES